MKLNVTSNFYVTKEEKERAVAKEKHWTLRNITEKKSEQGKTRTIIVHRSEDVIYLVGEGRMGRGGDGWAGMGRVGEGRDVEEWGGMGRGEKGRGVKMLHTDRHTDIQTEPLTKRVLEEHSLLKRENILNLFSV